MWDHTKSDVQLNVNILFVLCTLFLSSFMLLFFVGVSLNSCTISVTAETLIDKGGL